MIVVCSYCRKVIREVPGGRSYDVSHGMCAPCAEHFDRLWAGMPVGEYLDDLPLPVAVVSVDGRILATNEKMSALLGRASSETRGLMTGEAMACVHSRLPEGCGKTVHCRECTIRRAIDRVAETGASLERVPAYLETDQGRVPLRISVRAKNGLVKVVVEEVKTAAAVPGKA